VDGDIVERLTAAERDNQIVVLLIDPWATTQTTYAEALRRYDDRFECNSGALVAWNKDDPATSAQVKVLGRSLREALPKKTRKRDASFHDTVASHIDFQRTLLELLVYLQTMLSEHVDPDRTIDVGVQIGRPTLSGPRSSIS
jgi:FxsC-like protein